MSVTWVTLNSTRDTIVEYGPDGLAMSVTGTQTAFQDGGDQKRVIYVHKALLTGLKPLQKYSTYALLDNAWEIRMKFSNSNMKNYEPSQDILQ